MDDYEWAQAQFEGIVGNYPDHFSGHRALVFVGRCLQKLNRENESIARRDQLVQNHAVKEIFGLGHFLAVGELVKLEQYAEAIDRCLAILQDFPETALAKYALYDLGSIHWYRLADQKTGEAYYRELIANWPDDDLSISALATLGEWVSREQAGSQPESESPLAKPGEIPGEFAVSPNYPNPFNPTTTIRYSLPVDAEVLIKVYDVLGQEVAVLVDEVKRAGTHSANFDATNFSSGVYFYSISAGDFHQTKKMILVK